MGRKLLNEVPEKLKLVRKNYRLKGNKVYLVYKLVDVQSFRHAHSQDIRRRSKAEEV